MSNSSTLTQPFSPSPLEFLREMLRGTAQVMFQNSAWTGFFFMAGIFWGAWLEGMPLVGWGALLGVGVSTLTGYLLKFPSLDGRQGLWGFNGVLVGCAFPTFLGNTPAMWLALILCAALTTWVRTGFNNVMAPWKVNSFTFPFVFCTWLFLLAARATHGIPPTHMAAPELPATFSSAADLGLWHLAAYWLRGIGQVFLIDSWVTGALFLIGLGCCNLWAALWAGIGSALSLLVAVVLHASGYDVINGLYGYSAVLTAIALATVFYKPGLKSALWAVIGILVTFFIQAGMYMMMAPLGLATLTGPFCVTTWLFLLPRIQFDDDNDKTPDHSDWSPANKRHLALFGHNRRLTAEAREAAAMAQTAAREAEEAAQEAALASQHAHRAFETAASAAARAEKDLNEEERNLCPSPTDLHARADLHSVAADHPRTAPADSKVKVADSTHRAAHPETVKKSAPKSVPHGDKARESKPHGEKTHGAKPSEDKPHKIRKVHVAADKTNK